MIVTSDCIEFGSGRVFTAKKGMWQLSENGYLRVVGEDYVIQSHELSLKEMTEMKEYLQEQVKLLDQFINNPLELW